MFFFFCIFIHGATSTTEVIRQKEEQKYNMYILILHRGEYINFLRLRYTYRYILKIR